MNDKLQALWQKMTADKKKFALMCTLVGVGLLLWGRLILLDRVPKSVVAAPDPEATQSAQVSPAVDRQPVVYIGRLPETAARDLFAIPRDRYRPVPRSDNSGNPGNSGAAHADASFIDLDELREQARTLRLQSVIHGIRPRIVINDQMLQTGDTLEGFKVLAIEPYAAVVVKHNHLFRLRVFPR